MLPKILDLVLLTWKIKHTRKGLFYSLGLWNALFSSAISVSLGVIKFTVISFTPDAKLSFIVLGLILFGSTNAALVFLWKYFTSIPNYLPSDIGIIFAPHYDEKCNDLIVKLYNSIRDNYKSIYKGSNIRFRLLPDNYKIRGPAEANDILAASNAYLIVHGIVEKGKLASEEVEGFKSISFTIKNTPKIDFKAHPLLKDVAHALAFRRYLIKENNSFLELDVLRHHLKECSTFFLGLSMILVGKHNEAMPFISALYEQVSRQTSDNPHFIRFKNIVEELYVICLESLYKFTYNTFLVREVTNREFDPYANQCLDYINKLIAIRKREHPYLLGLAIMEFHFGNIRRAVEMLKNSKHFAAQTEAAPDLSLGFIYLWMGDYKSSIKEYKLAILKSDIDLENFQGILSFLEGLKEKYPERIELRFAIGFFLENYCDRDLAKQEYREFLKHYREGTEMVFLFDHAKKQLEK